MRPVSPFLILIVALLWAGCRGTESRRPGIHPNLNMDFQERFEPQRPNPLFADNRSMRMPVPGTVARGMLREDTRFFLGREAGGQYVTTIPIPLSREILLRGQERYDIFCTVCHGAVGDGRGIIMTGTSTITGRGYGYTPAPTFHDDRLRDAEDGYLYDVIANGVRNMPAYAHQIPIADRWAIVGYVRALQRSQHASEADVPSGILDVIRQRGAVGTTGAATGGAIAPAPEPAVPEPDPAAADTAAQP
jgi:mono/diheme cytochrome c family protein